MICCSNSVLGCLVCNVTFNWGWMFTLNEVDEILLSVWSNRDIKRISSIHKKWDNFSQNYKVYFCKCSWKTKIEHLDKCN